ncbi:hypothetical protein EW145_g2989 [Phellinidium pouzarii]|uniref:FAD-binding PCMH-type domain-containing protein n=1 Tax=Phellinidium pouzarii TaxID=167371 RepID=A0A4V3XD19_9AGAM|nr:hypothetical protein EW145_g2989 [Phellinidium pouzarii]
MRCSAYALAVASFLLHARTAVGQSPAACRNVPGDVDFPPPEQWNALGAQLGDRLVPVIPSAEFCHNLPSGNCTSAQWFSSNFRGEIPGAMEVFNWEQLTDRIVKDYNSNPPSLCLLNSTVCGQGDVPLYAINVSSAADIQTGLKFAVEHNLKVVMKASGHDLLGRSTHKSGLLFWTHHMRNVSFTENFVVGGKDLGSAVTVRSGVPLSMFYSAAEAAGKMVVGGTAANVVPAGGYGQGAGHSAFSPVFGLAADNCLEYNIVIANGSFITANEVENTDLFWALRGGGAGSWGIVVSATFRTFPAFTATYHNSMILAPNADAGGKLAELHAKHIFDWDDVHAGQYFYFFNNVPMGGQGSNFSLRTYFANYTADQAIAAMKPLLDDIRALNYTILFETTNTTLATSLLFLADEPMAYNALLGSRLISEEAYRNNASGIGSAYAKLLADPIAQIGGHLVAGGKVAENGDIDAANPKWRTAKAHVFVAASWPDNIAPPITDRIQSAMTNKWVPILASVMGNQESGAYSNEANGEEPDFQRVFFDKHYPRLLSIKKKYDPEGLFIVKAGVGSEFWDDAGICRKSRSLDYGEILDQSWAFLTSGFDMLFKS